MPNLSTITSRGIRGAMLQTMAAQPLEPWLARVARRVQSDVEIETYADIGTTPVVRAWVGGRNPKEPRENKFTITNAEYEASIQIPYPEIRRARGKIDGQSKLDPYIQGLPARMAQHWSKLATDLVINGATALCYDGQFFFDTDHAEGASGAQSNKVNHDLSDTPVSVAGIATNPSPGAFAHAVMRGIVTMLGFKDDEGEPANEDAKAFVALVPLGLYTAAKLATTQSVEAGGATNVLAAVRGDFGVEVVPSARLTAASWTDKFALFRADGVERALILQEEEAPRSSAKAEDSEFFHDNNAWEFGIAASRAAGYADWKQGVQVTFVA